MTNEEDITARVEAEILRLDYRHDDFTSGVYFGRDLERKRILELLRSKKNKTISGNGVYLDTTMVMADGDSWADWLEEKLK